MLRWIVLLLIVFFVAGQLAHLRPSRRDKQLQAMRSTAARAGLGVRFWTARSSGYVLRQLPTTAFMYSLPWPNRSQRVQRWALWMQADNGETIVLAGEPPKLAQDWLSAFRQRYPSAWALLECGDNGLGVLWQELGNEQDVQSLAEALDLLQKSLLKPAADLQRD